MVRGFGKGKGAGSVGVGLGGLEIVGSGSEIGGSGVGGVEGAEVDVDVTLVKVGFGGKFGFGGTFGGHLDIPEVGGILIECQIRC